MSPLFYLYQLFKKKIGLKSCGYTKWLHNPIKKKWLHKITTHFKIKRLIYLFLSTFYILIYRLFFLDKVIICVLSFNKTFTSINH